MTSPLKYIFISGVDEGVDPAVLQDISREYPFVVWDVQLAYGEAYPGHPGMAWTSKLLDLGVSVCCHIRGWFVREMSLRHKKSSSLLAWADFQKFDWVQLNMLDFGSPFTEIFYSAINSLMLSHAYWIFRLPPKSEMFLVQSQWDVPPYLLLDESEGQDISPGVRTYPNLKKIRLTKELVGYFGGFTPNNLNVHVDVIGDESLYPFWLELRDGVRSGTELDLNKVRSVLHTASKYIISEV